MSEPGKSPGRGARGYGPGLALLSGWAVALLWMARGGYLNPYTESRWFGPLSVPLQGAILRVLSGFPGLQQEAFRLAEVLEHGVGAAFVAALFLATAAVPLGFLARMVARARLRAGGTDAVARLGGWVGAHPRVVAALLAVLPLRFVNDFAEMFVGLNGSDKVADAILVGAGLAVVQWRVSRAGLRALVAPLGGEVPPERAALDAGEIRFDAVAVTRETQGAIGGLAALTLGVVLWIASLPVQALYRDPRVFVVMAGYVALAAASALVFQRASRVAIGKDGIYVSGTSRRRFFPYRDLEEVRERRGDLELVRRGKVLLRLQLHGEDAARRAPILERIQLALASAQASARDGAAHFVASAPSGTVAASARGGTDYRVPSVSRDALWALVEGPGVDAAARTAAAHALAEAGDPGERRRLRVAAGHCADPQVRVALEELAGPDEERAVWRALRSLGKAP